MLIVLIFITVLNPQGAQQPIFTRQFYMGVEFAYGDQFTQVKALVDKVKVTAT